MKWIAYQSEIDQPLWEGELVLQNVNDETRGVSDLTTEIRNLPIVSIGTPQNLSVLTPEAGDHYHVIQLACSFRPTQGQSKIEWARFVVQLLPGRSGASAIAVDLYPLTVTQKINHEVKFVLRPSLKFQEIEGDIGEGMLGWSYPEFQPTITANGLNSSLINWDYSSASGMPVQGAKHMYMLLKVPPLLKHVKARIDLVADIRVKGRGLFPAYIPWKKQSEIDTEPNVTLV